MARKSMDGYVVVGAIAGGFGVKGEVRLKSFTANGADIAQYSPLHDENNHPYTIENIRALADGFAARIVEIPTREAAEALRSTRLYASRDRFPELDEDEYYVSDLIGIAVIDGHGQILGKIKAIQNYGAGDLLEIQYQGKSVLIPFTKAIVPNVDLASRRVIVDPPAGLLE